MGENSTSSTSNDHVASLFDAVKRDDLEAVKFLVEKRQVPLNTVNLFEETCAHVAAKKGNLNVVEYVLEKDPGICTIVDTFGNTLLSLAVENGQLHVVKYLVEKHKADILQPLKRMFGQPNVVHLAAESGQLTVLKYFVEERKTNVNATSVSRQPLAFFAARKKRLNIIKYLLEERHADLTMTDFNGDNILYMTVKENDLKTMKYLFDEKNVDLDVNWRNKFGRTLLHLAAFFNNVDILSYLVEEKGADVNIADNKGQTPLHRAAHYNQFVSCQYLIEHGADVELKDKKGLSPVEEAKNNTLIDYMKNGFQKRNRRNIPSSSSWIQRQSSSSLDKSAQCVNYLEGRNIAGPRFDTSSLLVNFLTMAALFVQKCSGRRRNDIAVCRIPLPMPQETMENRIDLLSLNISQTMGERFFQNDSLDY